MAEAMYIKHLYESEGKSLREIERITKLSFQTVQKYAYKTDWNEEAKPMRESEKYPVLGEYIPTIDEWLENDRREPRKQRHTAMQIYNRLKKEQQFQGGYSSVKRYVRKKKEQMKQYQEGFLPLAHPEAHAQIDFGKFKYYNSISIGQKGYALIITFPYSNAGWMQVFPSENQECLLEGMKRIFTHIGGVPIRVRADNMTTAVVHILKGAERVLTDGFVRFKLHYRFETDFCSPNKGNEKGSVENKVGYSRRNMLVPVPVIDDFDAYNQELFSRCDEDHEREHYKHGVYISELWAHEKTRLLSLPENEYQIYRYESLRVDNYGFAVVDTNKYGLPPELSGKTVQAKIFYNRIEFFYEHNLLKAYGRSYKSNAEATDWKQYMETLIHKPGAVEHTRFFNQIPKLWQDHLITIHGTERKSALMVLQEIVKDDNELLCEDALSLAYECGRSDADSIRQCYYILSRAEHHPRPLTLTSAPALVYTPNLAAYDSLTRTVVPESLSDGSESQ